MTLKGVVLAGGSGSRLFPLTLVTNKHLLPVYDRPMIYYPLATLKEMGCEEVLVVVGGRSVGDILELLHDGSDIGLSLTYRYQRGALGIAHAIGLARQFAGADPIAIVLGDNIVHAPLREFANTFLAADAGAGTVLKQVPDPQRFGVAEFDESGRIIGFEEKPKQPKSHLIPIGVYLFRPSVFDAIHGLKPSARGEFEITDLLNHYLDAGSLMHTVLEGEWMDAGTIEALLDSGRFAAAFASETPVHTAEGVEAVEAEAVDPSEVRM
ncbi:MAG TPA: sugar phosphate nucleotidyltransferase [Thermomicrobiales bacterium]|nr:sugar phosphate nucleotidyltransferase [Thermomicrobiales bacterium]